MPRDNQFRHQPYHGGPPAAPFELLTPPPPPQVDSDDFRRQMAAAGRAYRAAGVRAIYLLHGTFVGDDFSGLLHLLGQAVPRLGAVLTDLHKSVVDRVAGDCGNYTAEYARLFEESLAEPGAEPIPVRLFHWSSQNHHLGRAVAALRLFDELLTVAPTEGRILLWGHSHAGNVFALLTHLVAAPQHVVLRFVHAVRGFFGPARPRHPPPEYWQRVSAELNRQPPRLGDRVLDCVTFGTPIRYGWETGGYGQLLHIVNHRPQRGVAPHRAAFPPEPDEILQAADGDYVQQLGIAGTNTPPGIFTWRAWRADRRLHRLLQAGHRARDLVGRLEHGVRVAEEGTTLLVDYPPDGERLWEHLAGHAVYTREEWLPFHASEVARRFFG